MSVTWTVCIQTVLTTYTAGCLLHGLCIYKLCSLLTGQDVCYMDCVYINCVHYSHGRMSVTWTVCIQTVFTTHTAGCLLHGLCIYKLCSLLTGQDVCYMDCVYINCVHYLHGRMSVTWTVYI